MAVYPIRTFGDEILRKKCKEVPRIDDHIREILSDMAQTMYADGNGAGLAANQIGKLWRLIVIDMGDGLIELVNPVFVSKEGEQQCVEGCLSFPGRFGATVRPQKVTVNAFNGKGEPVTLEGEGDLAKCICHEMDHLDGVLFCDRVVQWL